MDYPNIVPESGGARRVDMGRGLSWLTEGWGMFLRDPGNWIGITVVLLVILIALAFVPLLGQVAVDLLTPIFSAGLLMGCRSLDNGGGIRMEHLFVGFKQNTGRLIALGVLYLLGVFVIVLVAGIAGGGTALLHAIGTGGLGVGGLFGGMLLSALIFLALLVPLLMAYWFAPALVLFRDMEPVAAMKVSFSACLANTLPFLIYGLFGLILMILAAIPLGLGFLVAIPVVAASYYLSYKDIFE